MKDELRNVGIRLAIKKPSVYFTATISGIFTLLSMMLLLSVFEIKEGMSDIVLPIMIIFFLYLYSTIIETVYLMKEEDKMEQINPLIVIGYSNYVALLMEGTVKWVVDRDEIIIREATKSEKFDFFDDNISIVTCMKDNEEIMEYVVCDVEEYEGVKLFRDEMKIDKDIIKAVED